MAATLNDQIGRVLGGRYRLIAPIGSGASAQVFLADDATLRRRVAVKILHEALATDDTFLRRFRAEAQAVAAMNHPHIMAVYDWGEDDVPFLVSEYLGGGSLRSMLDAGHSFSNSQALLVGLEAARGLEYAHRRSIVHRDIKPANLLFDEDGRLRIADFGIARALAEAGWTEPHGAVIGTVRYASPEQAKGEPLTGRSDVYALALVVNEAVTGDVPFTADTAFGTLMARIDQQVPIGRELGPLRSALERAGRPDPADRPDAGEFIIALMAAAEELERPAPFPLVGAIPRWIAAAAGLDATQLAPAVEPTVDVRDPPLDHATPPAANESTRVVERVERTPAPRTPPAPYAVDDEEERHRRRWPWLLLGLLLVAGGVAGGVIAYLANRTITHTVPNAVNVTEDDVRAIADRNHWLLPDQPNFDRSDDIAKDRVISTDPGEGTKLAEGEVWHYTVSLGPRTVPLPPLAGLPLADAVAALQRAGLGPAQAVKHANDEQVAPGNVIKADSPLTEIPKGDAVTLVVSDGPAPRTVPPGLENQPVAAAQQKLSELKLAIVAAQENSDTVAAGNVIRLEPAPGTVVARDSQVKVVVSTGPAPRAMPSVSGKTVPQATEILRAAGFVIDGVDGDPSKTVINTDPPAGEVQPYATHVRIIARRT